MKIGITGGIGSGKSAISNYLKKLGETVICADEVAHELTKHGEEGERILRSVFTDSYFKEDGALDRKALAALVFADREKRMLLNKALHPLIISRIMNKAKEAQGRVFIDAALLIQTGMHTMMDFVWLVTAKRQTRIKRIMQRDSLDRKSALLRLKAQQSDGTLKRYADEIITNDGSIKELEQKIDGLLEKNRE